MSDEFEFVYIDDKAGALQLCEDLLDQDLVSFDTETADEFGMPTMIPEECEVVLSSYCFDDDFVFVLRGDLIKHLRPWFESPAHRKIGHNLLYDKRVIEHNRVVPMEFKGYFGETLYLAWLEDNEQGEGRSPLDLKSLLRRHFRIKARDFQEIWGYIPDGKKKPIFYNMWDVIENPSCPGYNRGNALYYAALDAWGTRKLYYRQRKILKQRGYWPRYVEDSSFLQLLGEMEDRGIRLDMNFLQSVSRQTGRMMARSEHIWGQAVPGVNKRSTKQLAHVFFRHGENEKTGNSSDCGCVEPHDVLQGDRGKPDDMWPEGVPSTDSEVLKRLDTDEGCRAALIIRQGKVAQTIKSTFVDRYLLGGEPEASPDGRIVYVAHTAWNATLRTGRISGRKNSRGLCGTLQNVPRAIHKDPFRVRRAFVPRIGYILLVADYSQLELRVLASFAGELAMLQSFVEGRDLHAYTAKLMFSLPCLVEEVKALYKEQRYTAKKINFGIPYGMGPRLLQGQVRAEEGLYISIEEATEFIRRWYATYPAIKEYMKEVVESCQRCGYVETISGRRRYIPNINLDRPRGRYDDMTQQQKKVLGRISHAEHQAVNTPIQGSAGDIIKRAQVSLRANRRLNEMGFHQLLQIHDEIVAEVPIEHAEEALPLMISIMEEPYRSRLQAPLVVEGAMGFSWEEAK